MVKLANFIVGWFKFFPITFFCLASFGEYWNPLYYIFTGLALTFSLIYIFTNKWAYKISTSTTPIIDYFWNLYDRAQKILEEHKHRV